MEKKQVSFTLSELIMVSLVIAMITLAGTSIVYEKMLGIDIPTDFIASNPNNYEKVDSNIQTIIDTYNNVINKYYEDIDSDTIVNGAIEGMLEAIGDPYTTYMDASTYNNFNISLQGSYKGLGVEISLMNNNLTIVGIFKDTPASEAGLKLGDIITSVNGISSEEMSASDFTTYIRESENDNFILGVKRDGQDLSIPITKRHIVLKSVSSKVIEKNNKKIGYIYSSVFAFNTYEQFKDELNDLESQKIDSLIIDLRDNTGGELMAASNMMSLFLDKSKILYKMQSKTETIEYYSIGVRDYKKPIVILVNGNSASASEVMTAALKENINATIIGTKTYGKGTVQELMDIPTGNQYKITTRKWLTPKGNWVNGKGIEPDIEVELSKEYYTNPTDENDNQLQAAIKYLEEH